jgi:hypothetical protein
MICECGRNSIRVVTKFTKHGKEQFCEGCSDISPAITSYRDGDGQRVTFSDDMIGKWGYSIGKPITSKRKFANDLKRMGLKQRGDKSASKDRDWNSVKVNNS